MNATVPAARIPARSVLFIMLATFPVVCFAGALLTDLAYKASPVMQWSNFSAWLLAFGMAFAVIAAIFGAIARFRTRAMRRTLADTLLAVIVVAVLVLALINNLVHTRDTWQSVVPTGLTLSLLTVIAMGIAVILYLVGARAPVAEKPVQQTTIREDAA